MDCTYYYFKALKVNVLKNESKNVLKVQGKASKMVISLMSTKGNC
jgi:hypothetical protein